MKTSTKTNKFARPIQLAILLTITGWLISACQSGASKAETHTFPTEGDFAFYRYEVWKGNSLIFNSIKEPGDTSQTFVESVDLHSGNIIMEELMRRLPTMSEGDSISFDFGPGYQGRLHLLWLVKKADYPAYIEEGDKRRAAFEERLVIIKKEMEKLQPEFKSRAQAVADSTRYWVGELNKPEFKASLKSFRPGIQYHIIREGDGPTANKSSSWTWVQFCAALPNGEILHNSYKSRPVLANRRGALMAPWIEKSVVQFPEGSIVLLVVPYELAFGEEGNVPVPKGSEMYVLMEVLRANNM